MSNFVMKLSNRCNRFIYSVKYASQYLEILFLRCACMLNLLFCYFLIRKKAITVTLHCDYTQ